MYESSKDKKGHHYMFTMRQPDGPYSFWEMKERARILFKSGKEGAAEVRRHAKVSLDNRHRCQECFTCACVEVCREKQ